jgi:hypothetical protein
VNTKSKLILWFTCLLVLSGCGSKTVGFTGPALNAGPVTISAYINTDGEVTLSGTYSLGAPEKIGPSWDVGFQTTLNQAASKKYTLFILYRNSNGDIIKQECDINQPFEIDFTNDQWVKKIQHDGNGNIVVYVEPNPIPASSTPQVGNTQNMAGQWTITLNVSDVIPGNGMTSSCVKPASITYDFNFSLDNAGSLSGYYSLPPVQGLTNYGQYPISGKVNGNQFSFTSSMTNPSDDCNGNINSWQGSIQNNQISGTKTMIQKGQGACCTYTGSFTGESK